MTPRIKTLMSSGCKKGPQIYYPLLSKKSRQANPLQVPQRGPYGERYLLTGHFYISLDISLYLQGPTKTASLHVPPKLGPLWKQTLMPEPYLTFLSGSPVKEPSPETLRTELFRERRPIPRAPLIHLSRSPVDKPHSRFPNGAPMVREAQLQSLFYLSSSAPSK
jgi:hypothetical protein